MGKRKDGGAFYTQYRSVVLTQDMKSPGLPPARAITRVPPPFPFEISLPRVRKMPRFQPQGTGAEWVR